MKRYIIFLLIMVFTGINIEVYAYDWKNVDITLINQTEIDSQTILTLKDKQNRSFQVIYHEDVLDDKLAGKIVKLKNDLYAWRKIKIKDIRIMVVDNLLDLVIVPQEIMHNKTNLANAIPAGITMNCDPESGSLYYNFRIMKDDQFIRITGDYQNENELVNNITLAYDNPAAYLKRNEPKDIFNPGSSHDNEKLRQTLIYFYNEDWNGRHKAIPAETIHKVVQLKQNNPKISKSELWKLVKKEKLKITKREMELILVIYFNEFE